MGLKDVTDRIGKGRGLAILTLVAGAAVAAGVIAAGAVAAGATAAAAHPAASLPAAKTAARAAAGVVVSRPAPHILNFARGLRGQRLPLPEGPHHVTVAWNVDGCDHDYGRAGQCVPWTVPAPAGQGCQWLSAHGFGPLKVRGRDRLHLDANHDGVACDKGDA
jgi:hypothetical protein